MKSNEPTQVEVTYHAYVRYTERVEMIGWDELEKRCQLLFSEKQHHFNKKRFVCFEEIWWAYIINRHRMMLTTCYGKSDYDIPRGLIWAELHHDQIKLSQVERGDLI